MGSVDAMRLNKSRSGISGFDAMTGGGLPQGRVTLLEGGAGSGKTVLSLQTLVNGARAHDEPGIFVAFEESSGRIAANAATFGWDIPALQDAGLFFLDAQPRPDLIQSGKFDLGGMLAALDAKIDAMGAKRIVFDAIDVVLDLLGDPAAARREIYRLHDWLLTRKITALITAKARRDSTDTGTAGGISFMQFMVDCAVLLEYDVDHGVSQRRIRVLKYRGSAFEENATPYLIGPAGLEVAFAHGHDHAAAPVSIERVSSGVDGLDEMLGGGYYRGASILLTGAPGTAKTTLAGTFTSAACKRGEKTLFVSFDSPTKELVRNLTSVNIELADFVRTGLLQMTSMRAISASAEVHLMRIRALARAHGARCLVVDPLSALAKAGDRTVSHSAAERLIDWTKGDGITLLCTSLLDESSPQMEGTPLQISTVADTWIHLSYVVHAGERNRGLSIVKSRGTGHSNQVRELLLSDEGVSLADVYTSGGEVLMGTLRWEREREERLAAMGQDADTRRQKLMLETETAEIEARLAALQHALELKRIEQTMLSERDVLSRENRADTETAMRERRGMVVTTPSKN